MNEAPKARDRDVFTDIADTFLALFHMTRSRTQGDYVLMPPPKERP